MLDLPLPLQRIHSYKALLANMNFTEDLTKETVERAVLHYTAHSPLFKIFIKRLLVFQPCTQYSFPKPSLGSASLLDPPTYRGS